VASHAGTQEEARKALEPLLELDDLVFGFVDPMPYVEFQKTLGGTAPHHARYYWKSHFLPELEDGAIDLMIDSAPTLPGAYSMMFIEILGGAVGRVGPTETAFANRSSIYNVGISTGWTDAAMDEEAITRTRAVFDALTPYSDGGVYLNYVDQDEAPRTAAAFGPNFERLAEIKKRYDPGNLFGGALGAAS
jgi:hypothetical protein